MSITDNPFCPTCKLRIFPLWENHNCTAEPNLGRIRHLAGDFLSNLHYYRVPAEMQIAALAEAFAYALATNVHPDHVERKMGAVLIQIGKLVRAQTQRIRDGTNKANVVMDINQKRLTIKRKKRRR